MAPAATTANTTPCGLLDLSFYIACLQSLEAYMAGLKSADPRRVWTPDPGPAKGDCGPYAIVVLLQHQHGIRVSVKDVRVSMAHMLSRPTLLADVYHGLRNTGFYPGRPGSAVG